MRQLYAESVRLFNESRTIEGIAGLHEDLQHEYKFDDFHLILKFRWAAFVDERLLEVLRKELALKKPADLITVGSAVWTMRYRNASTSTLTEYRRWV